jgi:hypothetical protein
MDTVEVERHDLSVIRPVAMYMSESSAMKKKEGNCM